jgi:5-methylcytosine-specific restriction endonuclease McrA
MSDRRYSTAQWQRLRKAVLARDGHECMIGGPRCRGYATTVHHQIPSSQAPELFWEPSNLAAACTACNYAGGSRVAAANAREREAQLRAQVEEQRQHIDRLLERLSRYETPDGRRVKRPMPAIY